MALNTVCCKACLVVMYNCIAELEVAVSPPSVPDYYWLDGVEVLVTGGGPTPRLTSI